MLITALLFAVASVPTFLLLRERKTARATAPIPVWARVASILRQLRGSGPYRDMRRFMVCVVFYQAGIQAVIALAAIYAVEAMGFTTKETIGLIFVVNITAALGAFGFGYWQDRIGHRRAAHQRSGVPGRSVA